MSSQVRRGNVSFWRPGPALVIHVTVVAASIAAAVMAAVLAGAPGMVTLSRGATSLLQLGLPLSAIFPLEAVNEGQPAHLSSVAWMTVLPLYLLAVHWSVGAAVRRALRGRPVHVGSSAGAVTVVADVSRSGGRVAGEVAAVTLAVGVGALCWAGWLALPAALGLEVPGTASEPYGPPLAYLGAVATAVVMAVVMARVVRSISGPLGVSAGLWMAHAVWLCQQDSAFWAFAAYLALPVAAAVALLATTFSLAAGLTGEMLPAAPLPPPTVGWVFASNSSSNDRSAPAETR